MARDFLTEEQIGEYQDAFSRFDTGPILDFRPAYKALHISIRLTPNFVQNIRKFFANFD